MALGRKKLAGLVAMVVMAVALSGCLFTTQTGPVETERWTIELGGAERVTVDLKMGAGGLTLSGGPDDLAEAAFTYNVADWRPTIDYVVAGDEGELHIEQPEVKNLGLESYRYEWDVRLNDEVPMALDLALGAGQSEVDVSTLTVNSVDLKVGMGQVRLDLTGDRDRDVDVTVRGGVGEATVLLPEDVGVKVIVEGGLGEVDHRGFAREGDAYVNGAYGTSDATVSVDIEGGIGGVTLKVVEKEGAETSGTAAPGWKMGGSAGRFETSYSN